MEQIAKALIESGAIHIEPKEDNFFTWTSGKRSPIYCDNRQLISYPTLRKEVVNRFCDKIKKDFPDTQLIAGTATAGIPWAAWIANELELPMVYIRSKPKGHGLKSAIEGKIRTGQKTLIIEDLISTGKSSIEAVTHSRKDNLEVLGVLSIFNYGFRESVKNFSDSEISFYSLCSLDQLLEFANNSDIIDASDVNFIKEWSASF